MRIDRAESDGFRSQGESIVSAPVVDRGLRRRWRAWRNAILSSPRFQRWAADFPPTRAIARRRAGDLFGLLTGFVYSQILLACVRVRLFEAIGDDAQSVEILAQRCRLPPSAMDRLLRAAASLRLVESAGEGRYALGPQGATLRGNPSLAAMIEHHALFYADLTDPVALLKGEIERPALQRFWAYADRAAPSAVAPDEAAAYSSLMAATQGFIADDVLDAYAFGRHRSVLDVGGGEGAFLIAVGKRHAGLALRLFDLPPVAERAAARFGLAGLGDRAAAIGGDFTTDALPQGADLVTFVRVLHDHGDDTVNGLLCAAKAALAPGGTVLIAEPMAGTRGAETAGDGYFGMYFAAMGSGRARSADALESHLRAAAFSQVRLHQTRQPLLVRVMSARA
jgi:demethylspheroidene O-methyltransferase